MLGTPTQSAILKKEHDKLHQEFESAPCTTEVVFDNDFAGSDVINMVVNGQVMGAVTYASSHDNTMDLLVTAIELLTGISAVNLTDASTNRTLEIVGTDKTGSIVVLNVVAAGGNAPTGTVTEYNKTPKKGMPMIFKTDGTVEPAGQDPNPFTVIGMSVHDHNAGELITVMCKGHAIIWAESQTDALVPGPVLYDSWNYTSGFGEYDDASVTAANIAGWAIDTADDGDLIRVIVI